MSNLRGGSYKIRPNTFSLKKGTPDKKKLNRRMKLHSCDTAIGSYSVERGQNMQQWQRHCHWRWTTERSTTVKGKNLLCVSIDRVIPPLRDPDFATNNSHICLCVIRWCPLKDQEHTSEESFDKVSFTADEPMGRVTCHFTCDHRKNQNGRGNLGIFLLRREGVLAERNVHHHPPPSSAFGPSKIVFDQNRGLFIP